MTEHTTELALNEYRITQIEKDMLMLKETLYGQDGLISNAATVKHAVLDIKEKMDKKDNKEWIIISGIALTLVSIFISNFFGS